MAGRLGLHTIWILSLEPIETRYTAQWYEGVPRQIAAFAEKQGISARIFMDSSEFSAIHMGSGTLNIVNIPGDGRPQKASEGAFLNFTTTNLWKNDQVNRFIGLIYGKVKSCTISIFMPSNPTHPQSRISVVGHSGS
jgi:hypothetical protein